MTGCHLRMEGKWSQAAHLLIARKQRHKQEAYCSRAYSQWLNSPKQALPPMIPPPLKIQPPVGAHAFYTGAFTCCGEGRYFLSHQVRLFSKLICLYSRGSFYVPHTKDTWAHHCLPPLALQTHTGLTNMWDPEWTTQRVSKYPWQFPCCHGGSE